MFIRQGNDSGTQYRSCIYWKTDRQSELAESSRKIFQAELDAKNLGKITTEIRKLPTYYIAEEYHQQYLDKNPGGYCSMKDNGLSCVL